MYKNILHKVTALLLMAVCFFLTVSDFAVMGNTATRDSISLDGTWKFATDPNSVGETEEWFKQGYPLPKMPLEGYAKTADGTIQVPGSWDAQGYGTENEKIKHCYTGKGWYKKTVSVPKTWKDQKIFLRIIGIARYAKIWINGLQVEPEMIGCLGQHEREVTKFITPGQDVEITICVDSKQRYEIDALFGAGQLADYICNVDDKGIWCGDTWGGIWGHVFLESRPQIHLEDLFIRTKIDGTCNAQFVIINDAVTPNADTLKLEIFETNGKLVVSKIVPFKITDSQIPTDIKIIEAKVPNVKLWSPESTNLYIAKVTLLQNTKPLDVIQTRFGIREFAINGSDFLLNGKKLMLCGYGDDHIYPQEWSFSSDKEMYLKRLRIIRSFGFNFVRHHSAIMPQEYYEACDEIGMIPTAEFPIVYQPFMPGEPYWRAKVPEGTSTEPAFKLYLERWEATIKQLRNHPCIFAWMMGNELGGPLPQFAQLRLDFQRIAKTNDPDRFFCDTDGGDWKGYFDDPKNNRDTLDFVSYQFDEWCSPILDTNKFILSKQQKPTLSHESGNYITFTRPDEIELYETSNFKPFWMVEGKVKLEQLGLLKEANNWAVASEKLYLLHHKYNLESLRKVPTISGYTWWLFQDYWTTSNGLVDTNFRLKSIKPEEVLPFNSPVVLLQNGLERTYRSGEKFKATLWGSNYSSGNLTGKMLWKLSTNDKIISENSFDIPVTEQGLLNTLGEAETVLPKTELPVEITFSLQLDSSDGNCCKNSWATWLFPKNPVPKIDQTPVYIDHTSEEKCPRFTDWKFQPIPDTKKLPAHAVYVVSWLTPAVGDALERGAGVILLGHITTIPDIEIRYQQTWWKGGDSNDKNHVGTYIYDNPITKEMAPDHWGNIAWAKLLEGAVKFNFETAPATPEIIVRALPSLVCVQNTALLYKVGVGKGTLIVSGLNHVKANECPENDWIMKQMVENVAQFSPPAAQWSTEFCFPKPEAPDGMIVGFRNILSQKYEESIGPSYRSQKAKFFICRQTSDKNILEWETENIPKNIDTDNVTLIFAGGLGFEPEPKTEGFEFLINDKVVLKFDLPEPTEWKSEDGKTVLKLHVKKSTQADTWGVFTLIVPKDFFEQGEVLKLGVRSLGKESRRWFGLNPLFDLKNDL